MCAIKQMVNGLHIILLTQKKSPMKKTLLISMTFLLLVCCGFAVAQSVTGKVTSAVDGAGIPGVSVVLKGTTVGTSTDAEGKFVLNSPEVPNGTLLFSF